MHATDMDDDVSEAWPISVVTWQGDGCINWHIGFRGGGPWDQDDARPGDESLL